MTVSPLQYWTLRKLFEASGPSTSRELYAHARNAPGRSFDCASPEPEVRQLIEDGFIRQVSAGLFEIGDRGISLLNRRGPS